MQEIRVVRYPAIYDFSGIQVGDHSKGSFLSFAELTCNASDFNSKTVQLE